MTITIEVLRGAGTRDGGEVSEALLGDSLVAALARGRAELDAHACNRDRISLTIDYRADLLPGARIAVNDPELGALWQGTVVGVAHSWDGSVAQTVLTVDRTRTAPT